MDALANTSVGTSFLFTIPFSLRFSMAGTITAGDTAAITNAKRLVSIIGIYKII